LKISSADGIEQNLLVSHNLKDGRDIDHQKTQ